MEGTCSITTTANHTEETLALKLSGSELHKVTLGQARERVWQRGLRCPQNRPADLGLEPLTLSVADA